MLTASERTPHDSAMARPVAGSGDKLMSVGDGRKRAIARAVRPVVVQHRMACAPESAAAIPAAAAKKLAGDAANAPAEKKTEMANAAKAAAEKQKQAEAMMSKAVEKVKVVTDAAAPKDIVDIYVSAPIRVSVKAPAAAPVTTAKK